MHRPTASAWLGTLFGVLVATAPVHAQSSGGGDGDNPWYVGAHAGVMGLPDVYAEYMMYGINWTQEAPKQIGGTVSLSAFPEAFSDGPFSAAFSAGAVYPIAAGKEGRIMPTAGLRLIFGSGKGNGDLSAGVHAGVVVSGGNLGPVRLRAALSREQFIWTNGAFWILQVGLERRTPMGRKARTP